MVGIYLPWKQHHTERSEYVLVCKNDSRAKEAISDSRHSSHESENKFREGFRRCWLILSTLTGNTEIKNRRLSDIITTSNRAELLCLYIMFYLVDVI